MQGQHASTPVRSVRVATPQANERVDTLMYAMALVIARRQMRLRWNSAPKSPA